MPQSVVLVNSLLVTVDTCDEDEDAGDVVDGAGVLGVGKMLKNGKHPSIVFT